MVITVTQAHLDKGDRLTPVTNPLSLAVADAIKADDNFLFVYISIDGLLKIHNLDKKLVFSQQLGPEARYFLRAWDYGVNVEAPYAVDTLLEALETR